MQSLLNRPFGHLLGDLLNTLVDKSSRGVNSGDIRHQVLNEPNIPDSSKVVCKDAEPEPS